MYKKLFWLMFGLLIIVTIILPKGNRYKKQQETLAKEFGVKIQDYPWDKVFPVGYFYTILKPEMKVHDVHKIIIGYKKVYHCHDYKEIYYYFDTDDLKALRFEVFYDENRNFKMLQGEDEDSRSIIIVGCEEGVLDDR